MGNGPLGDGVCWRAIYSPGQYPRLFCLLAHGHAEAHRYTVLPAPDAAPTWPPAPGSILWVDGRRYRLRLEPIDAAVAGALR
jgi:hypothetical protein